LDDHHLLPIVGRFLGARNYVRFVPQSDKKKPIQIEVYPISRALMDADLWFSGSVHHKVPGFVFALTPSPRWWELTNVVLKGRVIRVGTIHKVASLAGLAVGEDCRFD